MTGDEKYIFEFTKDELITLNDILYEKIGNGGRLSDIRFSVGLFDKILNLLRKEYDVYE